MLEVLIDHLRDQKHFVRVQKVSSKTSNVASGVLLGLLLGPILLWIFVMDLPVFLVFAKPFLFADDPKILVNRCFC